MLHSNALFILLLFSLKSVVDLGVSVDKLAGEFNLPSPLLGVVDRISCTICGTSSRFVSLTGPAVTFSSISNI